MGTLKPGAEIIYESPDGGDTIYKRYRGTEERFLVGMTERKMKIIKDFQDNQLWHDIREAAEHNEALKRALEQCIILYQLSKKDGS